MSRLRRFDLQQRQKERPPARREDEKPGGEIQPPSSRPSPVEKSLDERIRQVRERIREMRERDPLREHERDAEERARSRRERQGE